MNFVMRSVRVLTVTSDSTTAMAVAVIGTSMLLLAGGCDSGDDCRRTLLTLVVNRGAQVAKSQGGVMRGGL